MGDGELPEGVYQPGPFLAFLDTLGLLDQVPLNIIRGRIGSAGRVGLEVAGRAADALIPGDAIPNALRPGDRTSAGEALGYKGKVPQIAETVLDLGIETAINPLTYASFPAGKGVQLFGKTVAGAGKSLDPLTVGGKALRSGLEALADSGVPLAGKAAQTALAASEGLGRGLRAVTGRRRIPGVAKFATGLLSPKEELAKARALGSTAGAVGLKEAERILKGISKEEGDLIYRAVTGLDITPEGVVSGLLDEKPTWETLSNQVQTVRARLEKMGIRDPKIIRAAEDTVKLQFNQFKNEAMLGVYGDEAIELVRKGKSPTDYLARNYVDTEGGAPFYSRMEIDDFLKRTSAEGDLRLDTNLGQALMNRSSAHAKTVERSTLAKLLSGSGELSSSSLRESVKKEIEKFALDDATVELADELRLAWEGIPKRGVVTKALAYANKYFKPYAVYGYGIPKFASIMRNILAAPFMVAAETSPLSRETLKSAARIPGTFLKSVDDAIEEAFGVSFMKGKLSEDISKIDAALSAAKGDLSAAKKIIAESGDEVLSDAMQHGVIDDGFVNNEIFVKQWTNPSFIKKFLTKLGDIPARSFQGSEQRMRMALFRDLREAGMPAGKAADAVKNAFYDYRYSGAGNRLLRDLVPFAQFTINAIPQQAGLISRYPGVGVAASNMYGQSSDVVNPWIAEKGFVRIGETESGNPLVATGFGLPMETLGIIPRIPTPLNLKAGGRDVARGVLASAQPLLKTGLAWAMDRDPYFGTPFGEYSKVPGGADLGTVGKAYNVVTQAGLNPLNPLFQLIGKLSAVGDRGVAATAIDTLTGANVVEVDPAQATEQVISDYLSRKPGVKRFSRVYQEKGSEDPVVTAVLSRLSDLRKQRQQKQREASENQPSNP